MNIQEQNLFKKYPNVFRNVFDYFTIAITKDNQNLISVDFKGNLKQFIFESEETINHGRLGHGIHKLALSY